ncbi:MAG TPA: lipoyl(octanoyl) transferase LipB [Rhodocyclaceae bacterium]
MAAAPAAPGPGLLVRDLGRADYLPTWQAMIAFTAARDETTPDELWCVEHPPVFTLGQAGKPEHVLRDIGVPVVKIDRGGQVTYHGPGQAVVYLLLDLRRRKLKVGTLVARIEAAVIELLAGHGVEAQRRKGAPGVYLGAGGEGAKIASLGLKVRNGCCYHGVSLNVDLDLAPFAAINPCGYPELAVARTCDLGIPLTTAEAGHRLAEALTRQLEGRP